jgi:addiction module RelE/StbE family toxin
VLSVQGAAGRTKYMQVIYTNSFKKDYNSLTLPVQRQADKKLGLLISNPRHPSLQTKKMKGTKDIWEARISRSYRMTFNVVEDFIILRRIGTHDILRAP